MKIGQVRAANRLEIDENGPGLPNEVGQNKSELVKTGSKLGQIGRDVTRKTPKFQGKKPRSRGKGPNFRGGGGGFKRGGGGAGAYKIPAARGLKIYTPHPPPLKNPSGQKWGGGGGFVISPWVKPPFYKTALFVENRFLSSAGVGKNCGSPYTDAKPQPNTG